MGDTVVAGDATPETGDDAGDNTGDVMVQAEKVDDEDDVVRCRGGAEKESCVIVSRLRRGMMAVVVLWL
jgi:hypothetical protein